MSTTAARPENLSQLRPGDRARVLSCSGMGAIHQRLCELGLVPGADVRLVRRAPLGDPLEVQVGRFHLALRKAEARMVQVEAR